MAGIFSYCHPPINLLSNFDSELQDFFKNVLIKWEEKVSKNPEQFREALTSIAINQSSKGRKLCFDDSLQRIAYLFRYSPCYTSAVANHFLRLVKKNPTILKDAMWKRQVNICCLGGGPGTEVVALCKILSSAQDCFWQVTKKSLHLQVTIVDKNRHWKKTAIRVLQTLKSSSEMFDEGRMEISFRFLEADLTESLEVNVLEALQEADILTIVKLLSVLKTLSSRSLLKEIADNMKRNSVVFYLDTGISTACHQVNESLKLLPNIQCIYGPKEVEPFTLTLPSLKQNMKQFYETFHKNICLTSTIVSSCAWMKVDDPENKQTSCPSEVPKRVPQTTTRQWRNKWLNKAIESQEKLQSFHRKLRRDLFKKVKVFEDVLVDTAEDYPLVPKNVLFCNKSKDRRIFIYDDFKLDLSDKVYSQESDEE